MRAYISVRILIAIAIILLTSLPGISSTRFQLRLPRHVIADPVNPVENEIADKDIDQEQLDIILQQAWVQAVKNVSEQYEREQYIMEQGWHAQKNTNEDVHSFFSKPRSHPRRRRAALQMLENTKEVVLKIKDFFLTLSPDNKSSRKSKLKLNDSECALFTNKLDPDLIDQPCDFKSPYRNFDGSCNNVENPAWGQKDSIMTRLLPPDYADGVDKPRESKKGVLPLARKLSLTLNKELSKESSSITYILMQFGQTLNHDITKKPEDRFHLSFTKACCTLEKPFDDGCMSIILPTDDPLTKKYNQTCMEMKRGAPAGHPECRVGVRENTNAVTSFIDGSLLYDVTVKDAKKFRNEHGFITMSKNDVLMLNSKVEESPNCKSPPCFKTGDNRVNQQPLLAAFHVLYAREHNRVANLLHVQHPKWDGDKIFQETRRIVIAGLQHTVYNEYLPAILGPKVMKLYDLEPQTSGYYNGYNASMKPAITNDFSSAGHRFGHSLIRPIVHRFSADYKEIPNHFMLADEFNNISSIRDSPTGLDEIVLGMLAVPAQQVDLNFARDITQMLYQVVHPIRGLDLLAINIQRGRDAGIPGYIHYVEYCTHDKVTSFDDLNKLMDMDVVEKLKSLYGSVEDIDLYVGGLAETRRTFGAYMGDTLACIVAQQFKMLKTGDRFYYENGNQAGSFTIGQLNAIRKYSFARFLCDNVKTMKTISPKAFNLPEPANDRVPCKNIPDLDLTPWKDMK